jgi:outer membrane lipoprotein SlyB
VGSAIAASQADTDAVQANLRSLGIPTTGTEWGKVGTVDGIGSLAAMLVGALVGGVLGERWHSKLTRRAVSGKYGPDRADRPTGRPAATMTVTAT